MAQLEIYITAEGDNTVSQYYTPKTKHVTFYNEAANVATIKVKAPVGVDVLCKKGNGTDPTAEFTVPAQDTSGPGKVKMFVCKSYQGKTFKYSAQIEGKNIEDPIIIIGKDSGLPGLTLNVADIGLGLLGGVVLTLVAQRLFMRRRPT